MDLVVSAMEHSENSDPSSDPDLSHLLWQHLSSQLIYFVLFQFASFPHMVISLYDKVFIDFSLTVKAATLIFISEGGSAISSAK